MRIKPTNLYLASIFQNHRFFQQKFSAILWSRRFLASVFDDRVPLLVLGQNFAGDFRSPLIYLR